MTSPLRPDAVAGAWTSGAPPAAGDTPPVSTVTRFPMSGMVTIMLPGRYLEKPLPEWVGKSATEQLRTASRELLASPVRKPVEVWRQLCLNGDVEVWMAVETKPKSGAWRSLSGRTSTATSPSEGSTSSTPVTGQTEIGWK